MVYDVAIAGGGPAGYTAAIRCAQYGLKVVLVERDGILGGTCLHVGCIPTKALLHNAELWGHLKQAADFGIELAAPPTLNWSAVLKRKSAVITKHAKGLDFLMKKHKIAVVTGSAQLAPRPTGGNFILNVTVPDGAQHAIEATNVILATGSEARSLPGIVPGGNVLTNVEILQIDAVPPSLVVIGAGAVGLEFASIFRTFGAAVTLLEFLPRIAPVEDEEISKELTRLYKKRGIDVNTGARVESVENTDTGVKIVYLDQNGNRQTKVADKALMAVGRAPRTAGLGLEATKAQLDRGFVVVNEDHQTAEPGLYAVGDIVAGLPQLAHVGAMSGLIAAASIAAKPFKPIRRDRIPGCTYSEPQIGSVGLTEAQAKEQGYELKIGKFPFAGNSKATILGNHDGFVKVVADARYGEILGVHILGPQATELVAEAVAVLDLEGTVEEMMGTIHAHPTLAEALLDGFAAVQGLAINA